MVKRIRGVISDWTEDEGTPLARRALVAQGPSSLVAYVGVPEDHPLAGRHYDDMPLDCHGGLTFADKGGHSIWPKGWYWYGWDYAHAGDFLSFLPNSSDRQWTVEDVEAEARQVMKQIEALLAESVAD